MKPRIELQISELVLRGLPYAQRAAIAAAIEQELQRILAQQGLPDQLAQGGSIPEVSLNYEGEGAAVEPAQAGFRIAQRIMQNLSGGQK
jgi:hypothetical protein